VVGIGTLGGHQKTLHLWPRQTLVSWPRAAKRQALAKGDAPLVFSHKTLAELASAFSFADQSHFTKEFRRFLGETPSAYRACYARR